MRTWRPPEWMLGQEQRIIAQIDAGKRPHGAKVREYKTGKFLDLEMRQTAGEFADSKFRLTLPDGGYLVLDKEEISYWLRYA